MFPLFFSDEIHRVKHGIRILSKIEKFLIVQMISTLTVSSLDRRPRHSVNKPLGSLPFCVGDKDKKTGGEA